VLFHTPSRKLYKKLVRLTCFLGHGFSCTRALACGEQFYSKQTKFPRVTIRPGFSRTVLYFWVLSWISRCPGFEVFWVTLHWKMRIVHQVGWKIAQNLDCCHHNYVRFQG